MESIKQLLCEAINNQKSISFEYEEEDCPNGIRIGNPHAVFLNKGTDNLTVDVYQTDGVSSTPENIPDWRPFLLKKIRNIKIIKDSFDVNDGYEQDPESGRYDNIVCKI